MKPINDDKKMREITTTLLTYNSVLVAHDIGLFELMVDRAMTMTEIEQNLKIEKRPAEALVYLMCSMGLLQQENGFWSLTSFSREYLIKESPFSNANYLSFIIKNRAHFSFDSIKAAVLTNKPQIYNGDDIFENHKQSVADREQYAKSMFAIAYAPSTAWPENFDFSSYNTFADIGGGGGAHSISCVQRWPHLKGIILDMPPVLEFTKKMVEEHNQAERLTYQPADMFKDPLPKADFHFYSHIFHDWSAEECLVLASKSFEAINPNGMILLHECVLNENLDGPFPTAATNMIMLLWYKQGKQYRYSELAQILSRAGFVDIKKTSTFGFFSIISGRRP